MYYRKFGVIMVLAIMALLIGSGAVMAQDAEDPFAGIPVVEAELVKVDNTPRMLMMSAFDAEWLKVLEDTETEALYIILGHEFIIGVYMGNDVVLTLSGVSMENAAMNTQVAIDYFNVTEILFTGIAGGVNPELSIGDVAIPEEWSLYLKSFFARKAEDGWNLGWHSAPFGNFGMIVPQTMDVTRECSPGETESMFWFPVDDEMLAVAKSIEDIDLMDETASGDKLDHDPVLVVGGRGVSAPVFVDNAEFRAFVFDAFGGVNVLDMESAASAMVAYINCKPFIAFRALSDLAGGGDGENKIGIFFQLAADNSASVVKAFMTAWYEYQVALEEGFTFGMVLVGPKDDRGWSQAQYEGGQYVVDNVPGAEMLVFESLNSADKPETTLADVVELFVDEGAELIITTSDAFEEDTVAVAALYPDVVFINASGDDVLTGEAPENLGNVMAMSEWPRLIAGCAAALTTETGKLGYIGPLINAETRRVAASAYLGARYCLENYRGMDPANLTFEITWIGFWFAIPGVTLDTTEETHAFFDRGFDVVMSGLDTTEMVVVAGQRAAEGEQVWSMAYNSREGCDQAPESCLGVPYYHWGTAYLPLVRNIIAGNWEQSWDWIAPNFEDLSDVAGNITGFQVGDALSEENTELLNQFIAELVEYALDEANADTIFLWEGPLALQDGTVLIENGPVPMEAIWYLPQLLEGMNGASSTE